MGIQPDKWQFKEATSDAPLLPPCDVHYPETASDNLFFYPIVKSMKAALAWKISLVMQSSNSF